MKIAAIQTDGLYQLNAAHSSSKGNQLKVRLDDVWYKADYMGYEGLAEVLVSGLLVHSNLTNFVPYELVRILCSDRTLNGCSSHHFLNDGENLLTLESLYRKFTGDSLARRLADFTDADTRIAWTIKEIQSITHLTDFGPYLTAMLELDAFFLNEDRHTNNIAILYDAGTNTYRLCRYFDHGLSLLADTMMDFPLDKQIDACLEQICAKPFSRSFDEQMDAAEALYGQQLHLSFTIKDAREILQDCRQLYPDPVCRRVEALLRRQMRRYEFLFR